MAQRQNFPTEPVANSKAIVGGAACKYRFTVLTDGLIRYEYADDSVFEDRASTFAINRNLPVPKFRIVESSADLEIITDKFHLRYDKARFSARGFSVQCRGNITSWHSTWRFGDQSNGLGGTARTLDEANGRIPVGPGVISRQGLVSLDDSDTMLFTKDRWVSGRTPGERVDGYIFAYGHDYRGAINAFYAVSGRQPLLPRWALGNWWSRYYKYTADEYLALMDRFKEEKIPLSVGVLDMDWHLVDDERVEKSGSSGWTGWTWERKLFPDPKKFLNELHERDLKITLNLHPADGVYSYEEEYGAMAEAMGKDKEDGHPIAFDIVDKKFNDAYFDILLRRREEEGVDFWWVDWQQGQHSRIPGVDPLWMLNHFHFLDNLRDGTRPLTFSRYAGPGSHRYPVGFSGDTVVSWESLDFQPEFTATSSNIGYAWWSHDIGGHFMGYRDDELAARWVQLGVFSPILRLHSSNNPWNSKEPWKFTQESRSTMNEALRLRNRLIPYIYSMNVKSAKEGQPLIEPMYYNYPDKDGAYRVPNQFLFGSELIVMPMTTPRDRVTQRARARAWLPPGRCVDVFSGVVYDGDCEKWLYRRLEDYAVLAHEGAIIPLDAAEAPGNGGKNPEMLEVKVIVGADGAFEIYEDNGHGNGVEDVNWAVTPITLDQNRGVFSLGPVSSEASFLPPKRSWTITFPAFTAAQHIRVSTKAEIKTTDSGTTVQLDALPISSKVTIDLGKNPQLAVTDATKHIFRVVDDAQMDFEPKKLIWSVVTSDAPLGVKVSQLTTMDLDQRLLGAILEFLCADSRPVVKEEAAAKVEVAAKEEAEVKESTGGYLNLKLPMV
ncbi:hypothetical protein MMC18_002166 [Xylographa bjoerkii]|nr:hypothetical protein [Xylographa bjoerkii]